jgi:hypothetical protein
MAVAAAEQIQKYSQDFQLDQELVYDVSEMGFDSQVRQRTAALVAATLSRHAPVAELCEIQHPIESLYDAIQKAAAGDENAEKVIETNAKTDVIERTIKTGIVMDEVPLVISSQGKLMQYGQSLDSVQANSIKHASDHPTMRERTEAEARNSYRKQYLNDQGWFDDYSMVVFSRAENLPEAGFFTETMSCAIQVTSKKDGVLSIEPAFVAGIKNPGEEQHDAETIIALGKLFGIDYTGMTPAEIIDHPVLVHNSLIPNGAIDVVKMFDECAGGTFFGEDKPQEDYVAFRQKCRQRVRQFEPKVAQIKQELIAEASTIANPVQAVQRLHKISEKHMVEYALHDTTIDARVFGTASAMYLEGARWHREHGQYDQAQALLKEAKATADSDSCPTGMQKTEEKDGQESRSSETSKSCSFISKKCPVCKKKNVHTTVTDTHIEGKCGCRVKK